MKLDGSQPWMKNHVLKVRICFANRPMVNPAMRAYQQEFASLSLAPKQ